MTDEIAKTGGDLVILVPVYNDWAACGKLLRAMETVLQRSPGATILVVDDGSTEQHGTDFPGLTSNETIRTVQVLRLRRNLGHQRAIAIGLAYIEANLSCEITVVMDSDGEDRPEDVPRLIDECVRFGRTRIVFAERTKRSESLVFRIFYAIYKLVHVFLTGRGVRVGNFSAIPRSRLESLVVVSDLWNHYAAAAFASRQPLTMIPTIRGKRLDGKSTMNFIRLVTHGLSAISVYVETVGVRLLVAVGLLSLLTVIGLAATVAVRVFTDLAIPGWATTVFGILLILLFQAVMFMFVLSFIVLGGRNGLTFLPFCATTLISSVGSRRSTIRPVETRKFGFQGTKRGFVSVEGAIVGDCGGGMSTFNYVGEELDLFSAATNWKSYFRSKLSPYLGQNVLEVGAGLGGTTRLLCRGNESRWVCLEPDPALAERLKADQSQGTIPTLCSVEVGTLETLSEHEPFDSILYIDVLEHIEGDAEEVARAARFLKPGGHVIALSPAHPWLYSPFDKAIGHYRRYTKSTLRALTPPTMELVRLIYLDSVGLLASSGNRLLLKSSMPNAKQIALWDKVMVPLSRGLDPILGYRLGKSVLGVWKKL